MKVVELIEAWGHGNVTSRNRATFEVTKEDFLTLRGDCIVAINADKGAANLSSEFKQLARQENAKIIVTLEAGGKTETVRGLGSPGLSFTHPTDLVARKSTFTSDRTIMISSYRAANDFSKDFIQLLKNPEQKVIVTLTVEV